MQDRSQAVQRPLSAAGLARWTLPVGALALVLLAFLGRHLFRSAEERLRDALEDARSDLLAGRDAEFLAFFAPDVRYQRDGGLAEIRRDLARFRETGIRQAEVAKTDLTLDGSEADVRLQVVFYAGMQPLGEAAVRVHAVEEDGGWKVASLSWK